MTSFLADALVTIVRKYPAVIPHLSRKARWVYYTRTNKETMITGQGWVHQSWGMAYKTQEFFLSTLQRLVRSLYKGDIGGEFIDVMANLISGQLTQAYEQAWTDDGNELPLPDDLRQAAEAMILQQYDYVDQYYRDIIDARVDSTPIDPLLARAEMWANQWNAAYEEARLKINTANGGKLIWHKGATEHGCSTCANLDGIVMYASEWAALGVHPRGYPNSKLECQGGGPANNCDCTLEPTDQRRTPNAYGKVEEIIL